MSDIWEFINKLYNVPNAVILGIACIGFGYALRGIKKFPNGAIPLTLIVAAAVGSILLQPDPPSGIGARGWNTKNALIGIGIGFLAWGLHKAVLKKIEDKFGVKFDMDNTTFFNKIDTSLQTPQQEQTNITNDEKKP